MRFLDAEERSKGLLTYCILLGIICFFFLKLIVVCNLLIKL